jgi:hypothetical protein
VCSESELCLVATRPVSTNQQLRLGGLNMFFCFFVRRMKKVIIDRILTSFSYCSVHFSIVQSTSSVLRRARAAFKKSATAFSWVTHVVLFSCLFDESRHHRSDPAMIFLMLAALSKVCSESALCSAVVGPLPNYSWPREPPNVGHGCKTGGSKGLGWSLGNKGNGNVMIVNKFKGQYALHSLRFQAC